MTSPVISDTNTHLVEISKIIEGAIGADRTKVIAYAQQLASKLAAQGENRSAEYILRTLAQSKTRELGANILATGGRIPVDGESRLPLADEQVIVQNEVEIYLPADTHDTVDKFIRYVREANRLLQHGMGITPSLLLHGPSGCGKTELGRFIAAQLSLPLITARVDALISSYLGSTAKNLRMLFEHAMSRPCILFLDEFDAVAKLRDDKYELGELKRVVIGLLQNIDALDNKTILLAATNHAHELDEAIWRRFAFKIKIDVPDIHARVALFRRFLKDFADDEEIALLGNISVNLTGAEIRQFSENAMRSAILSDSIRADMPGLLKDILKIKLPTTKKEKHLLAEQILRVRSLDPDFFTYRRLAQLFHVSTGHISGLLFHNELKLA